MEEYTQITLDQWQQWKEDIREKLKETAGNFVYIGYRLKQIRDSGMFEGANDIFEFANREYGLGKSTVSRFIAINEKFSEGGNSLELRKEYQSIGSSKLSEMLTLPDAECQMITEKNTVKDIRELKNFLKQDPEGEEEEGIEELTQFQKLLVDFFANKKDILDAVVKAIYEDDFKTAAELMNPTGAGTHKKGICFLFMYEFNTGVKIKYLMQPAPVSMSWQEVCMEVYDVFGTLFERGVDSVYDEYYGAQKEPETPINTESEGTVATSQQNVDNVEKKEENTVEKGDKYVQKNEKSAEIEEGIGEFEEDEVESSEETASGEPDDEGLGTDGDECNEEEAGREYEDADDYDEKSESNETGRDVCIVSKWILSEEERSDIWEECSNAKGELMTKMRMYSWREAENRTIPAERLEEMYQLAIDVAAGLEKLLRDKKESEGLSNE